MVKPPKTMQPEAVDLSKAGRGQSKASRAFGEDSFHNYMARKIGLQRQQFGVLLPPPPEPSNEQDEKSSNPAGEARLESEVDHSASSSSIEKKRPPSGPVKGNSQKRLKGPPDDSGEGGATRDLDLHSKDTTAPEASALTLSASKNCPAGRPDLFFSGVVVMVNGYTQPDTETLQRLLHRHGGDLEKYETSRITHILAQRLSTAKANMYKRQKRPLPVCNPSWIVDSVQAKRLLPHSDYLLQQVQDDRLAGMKSISSFFGDTASHPDRRQGAAGLTEQDRPASLPPADASSSSSCAQNQRRLSPFTTQVASAVAPSSARQEEVGLRGEEERSDNTSATSSNPPSRPSVPNAEGDTSSTVALSPEMASRTSPTAAAQNSSHLRTDDKYIDGRIRTVGTDPNFLATFFNSSRLSFIGSFKQRTRVPVASSKGPRSSKRSKRFVFHIDMDCFFASVVLRNFPEHRDKPVVISHHGKPSTNGAGTSPVSKNSTSECATCNYEARKYGIKKGMFLGRAKELCPNLVVLYYDFEGYEEVSEQVSDIVFKHAEAFHGVVEQVSCDEAYMEIHLEEANASPEQVVRNLAETIRKEIFEATECTATVGVASNKLLAKLATDRVKPNKSFVVDDYRDMLRSLRLRDLHGIGYRLDRKLTEAGLTTVEQIWELGEDAETELCRLLGPGTGKKIFGYAQGRDDRPVQPVQRKTIGAECNYGVRFNGPYGVDYMIEGLAREVEKRMDAVGVKGSKVTLKLKRRKDNAPPPPKFLGHGSCHNLSKSSDTAGNKATRDWNSLNQVGMALFSQMEVPVDDIRGMGMTVSSLTMDQADLGGDKGIMKWFSSKNSSVEKEQESDSVVARDEAPVANDDDELSTTNDPTETPPSANRKVAAASTRTPSESDSSPVTGSVGVEELASSCDIELPPLSQICMSQVEALPSPMREQVEALIQKQQNSAKKKKRKKSSPVARAPSRNKKPSPRCRHAEDSGRFRQTDIGRMMRLAAVKSGKELPDIQGESISLTQLESLPLEMQLQVANGDERRIGRRPPSIKSPDAKYKKPTKRRQRSPQASTTAAASGSPTVIAIDEDDTVPEPVVVSDPCAFFRENVLPLSAFMDENDPADTSTVDNVKEFFTVFLTENGSADGVKLLRAIRNRKDRWAGSAFESILEHVNRHVERVEGARIDVEWITGTS